MNYQYLQEGLNIRPDDLVWIKNGKAHRENGPAIQHHSGYTAWYFEGEKHRLNGPAIIWPDGSQEWFVRGVRHREDGPACIESDGSKEWWIYGVEFSEDQFNQWVTKKGLGDKLQSSLEEKPEQKKNKI